MGKKRKYLIKTVNLGEAEHPARIISEIFIQRHGKTEFSRLIRKLIITFLSDDPQFKDWKKELKIKERKDLMKKINELGKKLKTNESELEKMGVDVLDL